MILQRILHSIRLASPSLLRPLQRTTLNVEGLRWTTTSCYDSFVEPRNVFNPVTTVRAQNVTLGNSCLQFLAMKPSVLHPSSPVGIFLIDKEVGNKQLLQTMELMNRNARRGKRANRGIRPVSRQRRRAKRRSIGNHRR